MLLSTTWRGWRRHGDLPVEGLVFLTVVVYFAGVSASLRLAFAQYYVLTLILGTLLSGLGGAALIGRLPPLRAPLKVLTRACGSR